MACFTTTCSPRAKYKTPLSKSSWLEMSLAGNETDRKTPLDFDFTSKADGAWSDSYDFRITYDPDPEVKDITSNLCVWKAHIIKNGSTGASKRRSASKYLETLFVIDSEPRLQAFIEILMDRTSQNRRIFLQPWNWGRSGVWKRQDNRSKGCFTLRVVLTRIIFPKPGVRTRVSGSGHASGKPFGRGVPRQGAS